MKPQRLLLILAGLLGTVAVAHAQFIWTGLGSDNNVTTAGNWRGGTVPPNDGSAIVDLGYGLNTNLFLPANLSLNSVVLAGNDDYYIKASSAVTLTLGGGLSVSGTNGNQLWISPNITLNLTGAQVFDAGYGRIEVGGQITGSSAVTLISSSSSGGVFVFKNTSSGNSYTGATTVGNGSDPLTVAFWNSSPFGTGSVNVITGAGDSDGFIAHGTQTVANAFTFTGLGTVTFKSWDAPLNFSGPVTLASNTTLSATISQTAIPSPTQDGSFPIPGTGSRNPIVFSGVISGSNSLTLNGGGVMVLTGTNTYTGGTTINGSVVFGSSSSSPGVALVNGNGYAGDATSGDFTTFLTHINVSTSSGAVGLDTLPGFATATFTDAINLSSFSSSNIRIGTATSAILTGTITPQGTATSPYRFGNGGGTLYVQSGLAGSRALMLSNSSSAPLTLYLQGNDSYVGGTTVSNGFLIFDSYYAIPGVGSLVASGSSTSVGGSYIGYTDQIYGASTPTAFLGAFTTKASTWGILGFDTHVGNSTVSISNLNLTGFNDGVFIGTTTSAIIDASTLTGTTVPNGNNVANTLRFTAAEGGVLTISGNIADNGSPVAVMLASPSNTGIYSNGTVVMNGSSTYTGGTILNAFNNSGLTLALGNSSALGTGTLTLRSNNGGSAGLQATSGGINLPNAINLYNTGTPTTTTGPELFLTGTNGFTLSGNITGDVTTSLWLTNSGLTASLAGDNSNFLGTIELVNGALDFLSDHAPGKGTLVLASNTAGTVTFSSASPTLYGIEGDSGTLTIPGGTNLTFDVSNSNNSSDKFAGVISGSGSVTVIAPNASDSSTLYLSGSNTYTGGTSISGPYAVLALGSNTAAGTGGVTVNTTNGGLVLNSGVTFTNSLTYTAGGLGGFGTFSPSNLTNITFGTGQMVVGGLGGLSSNGPVGTLNFTTNVTFANGGTYLWTLQDVTRTDGLSLLNISGNLNITASAGGFNLEILTFDSTGNEGLANLTVGTPYSLVIAHASGGITGFSPSAFTINASQFQNGTLSPTVFTLTQSGNDLYLNFTPIPEPSTYALLGLGLGAVLVPALRRRRSLKS